MAGNNGEFDPFGDETMKLKYSAKGDSTKSFTVKHSSDILHANKIFSREEIQAFESMSRFGYINPYNRENVLKEYLFFTKPDLNLFDATTYDTASVDTLVEDLRDIPFFQDCILRHKKSMLQLQESVKDSSGVTNPFMYNLSNSVTTKLDLPSLSADSQESTPNLFSDSIAYRSHSYKSDFGYDFSLSFIDSASLNIYTMVKCYDEYMRLLRTGEASPKQDYIINHIVPEQFSIYKFLIGEDGETILYYAKLTGVYFTDVPRSDLSDPESPFRFSLGFHAQYVEDSNPVILDEFNIVASAGDSSYFKYNDFAPMMTNGMINNSFYKYPIIVGYQDDRANRHYTGRDYRLKWLASKTIYDSNGSYIRYSSGLTSEPLIQ